MKLTYSIALAGILFSVCACDVESQNRFKRLETLLYKQMIELLEVKATLGDQVKVNIVQQQKIAEQNDRIQALENKMPNWKDVHTTKVVIAETTNGPYNAHGCLSDEVPLSCADDRKILVTYAEYGQYTQTCDVTCCSPHPYDCTEDMMSTDGDQWAYIKYLCDNKTSCAYPFQGSSFVNECAPQAAVDYVSIYYTCLPEPTDEAVGFTAYATTDGYYNLNDVIHFDSVLSNFGGYYEPNSSMFHCPANGTYAFALHALSMANEPFRAIIMREDYNLTAVYVDKLEEASNSGSNLAIMGCGKGERVWVRCPADDQYLRGHGEERYSAFSGTLLSRF